MARSASAASRDPALSRERILAAAQTEFARLGLGGARVDRIASQAGLNKRMIYHYFGSKDGLFSAVLLANYARKRESEKTLQLEHEEPRQAICKLVSLTWNYYLKNPDFLNLLNSANLHQARHLKASTAVRKMHHPFVKMIDTILDNGVNAGVFKPGVDPVQLYITIAGLAYFYLSNQHTLSSIFHRNLLSPQARAQRLAHMTDVVLGYLHPSSHD